MLARPEFAGITLVTRPTRANRLRASCSVVLLLLLGATCGKGPMRSHGWPVRDAAANPGADTSPPGTAAPDVGGPFLPEVADAAPAQADLPIERIKPTCGNLRYDPGEECDDGNTVSGDGCSSRCKLECSDAGVELCPDPGFFPDSPWTLCCASLNMVVCGNGVLVVGREVCDDGNTLAGDGCSRDCQTVEPGYRCTMPGRACVAICGDRAIKGAETCDDGNREDGDGCSRFCVTEPGWDCTSGTCVRSERSDGGVDAEGVRLYCGDGILAGDEECDDGPLNSDEHYGCSKDCVYLYCGDGIVTPGEVCDLGARNGTIDGRDGCTFGCTKPHYCGDGMVDIDRGEECDLGERNGVPLDTQTNPSSGPDAMVYCTDECQIPDGIQW
jgi:cysteine-rich repeat protein